MNKKEVQKRVLQNGKPLALSKFSWDEKTNTFSSNEDNLVIDFTYLSVNVKTGYDSTVTTGSNSAVVIFNDLPVQIVICDNNTIQTAPFKIKGYLKNGIYSETGKPSIICDGILSEVISQKGNIYKVINYGQDKESYIVKDGDICSHGDTLEQAKDNLIYKISNRDTTPYKDWNLLDVKTKEELIKAYRVITGACESGTKYFCENTNIPDKCTVEEAIELTKGQYNSEKFKEFFKGVK